MVTHGIHYLPDTDLVVVLDDGKIAECGPYQELIDKKGAFSDFVLQHLNDGKVESPAPPSSVGSPISENVGNGHGKLVLFFKIKLEGVKIKIISIAISEYFTSLQLCCNSYLFFSSSFAYD